MPGPSRRAGKLTTAVRASVAAMDWLTDADKAAIELATQYARQIEAGVAEGGQDATKALYLGPHLLRTLADLGGTPAGRGVIGNRPARSPARSEPARDDDGDTTDDDDSADSADSAGSALARLREKRSRRTA